MSTKRLHDLSLNRGVETNALNRPDLAEWQAAVMLFAVSATSPAPWNAVFSCWFVPSSSLTIRIRAPSGSFMVTLGTVLIISICFHSVAKTSLTPPPYLS
jgi:hypothetical protein